MPLSPSSDSHNTPRPPPGTRETSIMPYFRSEAGRTAHGSSFPAAPERAADPRCPAVTPTASAQAAGNAEERPEQFESHCRVP